LTNGSVEDRHAPSADVEHSGPPAPDGSATTKPELLLEVSNLTVHFPPSRAARRRGRRAVVRAVDGVDLHLARGEALGLVGESGCGKSTTGRAIIQLQKPTSGSVRYRGQELTALGKREMRRYRRQMQLVLQDPYSSLNPRMSVGKILEEPLRVHKLAGRSERRQRVEEILNVVGLSGHFIERYPHELSGGQRQRVGIARALAVEPELVIADEAISSLDVSIQAQIINLLEDLQSRLELTYLFISHDLAMVRQISDRVAVMYLGKIVEVAVRDDLYLRPSHPYTQSLISAAPIPDPHVEGSRQPIILTGDVPSPLEVHAGCRFRSRCPLTRALGNPEICAVAEPPLAELRPGHLSACHFASDVEGVERVGALATPRQDVGSETGR
jgi:oligopeptide transport system ATP-binding protein